MFAEIYCIQANTARRWGHLVQSALNFEFGEWPEDASASPWAEWKRGVVAAIQELLKDSLAGVSEDDVDWDAWRHLYETGHSPEAAVNKAFLVDA